MKNNETLPFVTTCMDLECQLSQISQTGKHKYHTISTYMWNLKQNETMLIATENRLQLQETWIWGWAKRVTGVKRYKLLL